MHREEQNKTFKLIMELAAIIPGFKLIMKGYKSSSKFLKNIKILKELEI